MRKRNYVKSRSNANTARGKKLVFAAGILLALYLLATFIFGEMGLVKYYRMKAQSDRLSGEIAKLKQDNAKLVGDVHSLRTDPAHLERIARDKLGLARPGEIVYYYNEP